MLELFAWSLALPPLLSLIIFTVEVTIGLRKLRETARPIRSEHVVIMVPAHNEEISIGKTVQTLTAALEPSWRLLVVADNCSDSTAIVAAAEGAETIERNDPQSRGKGFALAYGRDYLRANPPAVVVIIDADCTIDQQSIACLVSSAAALQSPVQAKNLLYASPTAPPIVQISNFAMLVKNLIRARGLYRLSGGIPLFGTGMAIPWTIFQQAELSTSEMVEDLSLSIAFARRGTRVHLIEGASVSSPSARAEDSMGQRRRWEHGFMQTALKQAFPLLLSGLTQLSRPQIGMGLHLCVPPLALLLLAATGSLLVTAALAVATAAWAPAILLLCGLGAALTATLLAWLLEGRATLTLTALARVPIYVLRKLPMYGAFFRSRQSHWNRTPREGEQA